MGTGGAVTGGASSTTTSSTTHSTSSGSQTLSLGGAGGTGGGTSAGLNVQLADCTTPPVPGTPQLVAYGCFSGTPLVVTPAYVFWVGQGIVGEDGSPSDLYRVPVSCAEPVVRWGLGYGWVGGMAATASHVYVAAGGRILRFGLDDTGDPTELVTGSFSPGGLAVDDAEIFWSDRNDGTILRAPLGGGTPTVVVTGQNEPRAVALSATHVAWISASGAVRTSPRTGPQAVTVLKKGQADPTSLASSALGFYWLTPDPTPYGWVSFAPPGGPATDLWAGPASLLDLAVQAPHLYWSEQTQPRILRTELAAPGTPEVVVAGADARGGFAVGAGVVYWVDSSTRLWRQLLP
jgi:hypothetical protein